MSEFPHQPHNWLIHRLMWDELSALIPRYATGTLLDIGCGGRPYQAIAAPHVRAYVGLDFPAPTSPAPDADVHGDALHLPVASASVETVLCSELLEHLPRPLDAVGEMARVLKSGGHVILTTPLFWQIHEEPRDYYRYTKYGLAYLLEASGLDPVHTAELTGFVATVVQMTAYAVRAESPVARALRPLSTPLMALAQRAAYAINRRDRNRSFNCLTIVVARKG
jgi:SAM-dependent methyltransferase